MSDEGADDQMQGRKGESRGKSVRHKQYSPEQYSRGASGSGVECNVGMREYENEKMRQAGIRGLGKCGA